MFQFELLTITQSMQGPGILHLQQCLFDQFTQAIREMMAGVSTFFITQIENMTQPKHLFLPCQFDDKWEYRDQDEGNTHTQQGQSQHHSKNPVNNKSRKSTRAVDIHITTMKYVFYYLSVLFLIMYKVSTFSMYGCVTYVRGINGCSRGEGP